MTIIDLFSVNLICGPIDFIVVYFNAFSTNILINISKYSLSPCSFLVELPWNSILGFSFLKSFL